MRENIRSFDAPKFPTVDRIRQWMPELCDIVDTAARMEDSSASDWFYLASKEGVHIEELANSYAGPYGCGPDNNYDGPVYFFLDRQLAKALWKDMTIHARFFFKRVCMNQEINMRAFIPKFTGRQILWLI